MNEDWIGYQWLAREFGIEPVQPFPIATRIGRTRGITKTPRLDLITQIEAARPNPTLSDHLTYALKHEGVHLEFLARLYQAIPPTPIEHWVNREPSGQYARRAGFLYEWLTGKGLDFRGVQVGNYVSVLSDASYFTRTNPINSQRWRVRNNLPGTPAYCPTIRRTASLIQYESYSCADKLVELEAEFGKDILLRSAVWLTVKESKASFQIEHEGSQTDRIKRFASVMERRLGTETDPLADDALALIQAEILGEKAFRTGPRKSPVFVGESADTGEIVHYVAPHWDRVPALLEGLREFGISTVGRSSIIRAAALSFGFVFIHPMTDGNGRISRFIVNDTLRRDRAVPPPYLLPVSATINRNVAKRAAYDHILEVYSKPLMQRYSAACTFGPWVECEDGVTTNFYFSQYDDANWVWSFPDLTLQAEYLANVIRETVEQEMRTEASTLATLRHTRAKVKEVIEAPDVEIDRIIRSIQATKGVSGKLKSEFPMLEDPSLADALVHAVLEA